MKKLIKILSSVLILFLLIVQGTIFFAEYKLNNSKEYLRKKINEDFEMNINYDDIHIRIGWSTVIISFSNIEVKDIKASDLSISLDLKKLFFKQLHIHKVVLDNGDFTVNLSEESSEHLPVSFDKLDLLNSKINFVNKEGSLLVENLNGSFDFSKKKCSFSGDLGQGNFNSSLYWNSLDKVNLKIESKKIDSALIKVIKKVDFDVNGLFDLNFSGHVSKKHIFAEKLELYLLQGNLNKNNKILPLNEFEVKLSGSVYPNTDINGEYRLNEISDFSKFKVYEEEGLLAEFDKLQIENLITGYEIYKDFSLNYNVYALAKDFKMKYSDDLNASFSFNDLTIKNDEIDFNDLAGKFELNGNKVGINLNSKNANLASVFFNKEFEVDVLANAEFDLKNKSFVLKDMFLTDKIVSINAKGTAKKLNKFKITGTVNSFNVKKLKDYLPNDMDEDLDEWMRQAFLDGVVDNVDFIFTEDNVKAKINCSKMDLLYAKGWPIVKNTKGIVEIDKNDILVRTKGGTIVDAEVEYTEVKIDKLTDKSQRSNLYLDGKVFADFKKLESFILNSPFKEQNLSRILDLNPKGDFDLNLNFSMPLGDNFEPLVIKSSVDLKNASLVDKAEVLFIDNISGTLFFNESDFYSKNLTGKLFGEKADFSVLTVYEAKVKKIYVQASGKSDLVQFKEFLPKLFYEKNIFSGNIFYEANLSLPWDKDDKFSKLNVRTDFKKAKINLPEPLFKPLGKSSILSLEMEIYDEKVKNIIFEQSEKLKAKFEVEQNKNRFKIKKGHINFGEQPLSEISAQSKILIDGEINTIDFSGWKNLLSFDNSSQSIPYHLEMLVQKLKLANYVLEDTWISADSDKKVINFKGYKIDGDLIIGENLIDISLEHLNLPEPVKSDNSEKLNLNMELNKDIYFNCNKCKIYGVDLGALATKIISVNNSFQIDSLKIDNNNFNLSAKGKLNENVTNLAGEINVSSLEGLLKELNLKKTIKRGKGNLSFDLNWQSELHDLSFDKIDGSLNFKFSEGSVLGVQPGLGRIVGLLNVDNIKRRLRLDFSDLYEDGLSFDELSSDVIFKSGVMTTDKLLFDGPASTIMMSGNTDLKSQELDFYMKVTPKITGTLPIAAAIAAGNPAVGAAIWLFSKAIEKDSSNENPFNYKISGSWSSPLIKEIGEN